MFDPHQPLPSDYGSPGGDPAQLSSLAPGEGALPKGYGATKTDSAQPAPVVKDISDFAKGMTTALQTVAGAPSAFQPSGKASPPAPPPSSPADDASKKWKIMAALALGTALVGGTVWYGSRQGWFAPKGDL